MSNVSDARSEGDNGHGLQKSSGVSDDRHSATHNVEGGGDSAEQNAKARPRPDRGIEANESARSKEKGVDLYRNSDWERESEVSEHEFWRSHVRRDYARVVHSPSFRRLQGKTQLFPGHESDFFRNRLTHSLEVGQIAEAIAYRLNETVPELCQNQIDPRLCMTAGLMHDLGHPPFGHNGEKALDDKMIEFGGFEGNAQTLRIVTRLEKKTSRPEADGLTGFSGEDDLRTGLGLCYRSIASILKYDREIPNVREPGSGLVKGYYADDAEVVARVKIAVAPGLEPSRKFKTLECSIMDIADDIAYSTYDLEDSLKAGFLTPVEILSSDDELLARVAKKVSDATEREVTTTDILDVLWEIFDDISPENGDHSIEEANPRALYNAIHVYRASKTAAGNAYHRTAFTSDLVGDFVNAVELHPEPEFPCLSRVALKPDALLKVETLKTYTFEATIFSTRLKVAEFRGYDVISSIFDALSGTRGYLLMPDDVRSLYQAIEANATRRKRLICDFIAGMTDRYAIEFYGRLFSDAQTIFKPT
jgi:dGTPase